jgi:ATP-dependent RNA helicase DeaD
MKEMNSWIEVDRKVGAADDKAIDGKKFKGRRIRMNDANSRYQGKKCCAALMRGGG